MYFAMRERKQKTSYKLICLVPELEKVIGVHVIGLSSDETLQGFSMAVKRGATKAQFDETALFIQLLPKNFSLSDEDSVIHYMLINIIRLFSFNFPNE